MKRLYFAVAFAATLGATVSLPSPSNATSGEGTIAVTTIPCAGNVTAPRITAMNRRLDDRALPHYPEIAPASDGLIHVPAGNFWVMAQAGPDCFAALPIAVLPGRTRHVSLMLGSTIRLDDSMALAGTVDVPGASVSIVRSQGVDRAVMDGKTFYIDRTLPSRFGLDVQTLNGSVARFSVDLRDARVGDLATLSISASQIAAALGRPRATEQTNLIDIADHESWYVEVPGGILISDTRADPLTFKLSQGRTAVVSLASQNVEIRNADGRSQTVLVPDDARPVDSAVDSLGRLLFYKRDTRQDGSLYEIDAHDRVLPIANPSSLPITPNIGIVEGTFAKVHFENDTDGLDEYRALRGAHGFGVIRDGAGGFWALDCVTKKLKHLYASGDSKSWTVPVSMCDFNGYGRTELAANKDTLWMHAPRALSIVRFDDGKVTTLDLTSTTASVRTGSLRVAPDGAVWFIERNPQRAVYIRNDRVVELQPFDDGSLSVTVIR